ncbi:AAA family ATPase [Sporosarcina aquimarina]|uniref:MoxR family ATPase n=1 Tax=Sporosarcina aquimarina TaxID=114975 RepID=A0ABU4FXF8_9BACL|nr:MoxR family ATPase [Sporosarcina aquimarina]MDW0109383.1 MoxR family ATPase [Sporosarcina aquimarina]
MTASLELFEEMSQKMIEVRTEIEKFIVGQEQAIEYALLSILADGHALLEGAPGLGKTMLIRTISEALDLSFKRIQFTPDLMPSDITGTTLLERTDDGRQQFTFNEGPLFSQLVLADEINRATPKTQSALLEAMGEKTVTVLGSTYSMSKPFFVLATQNPIDMEGTYPLPEAQLDRFLCKINLENPTAGELKEIVKRTTGTAVISIRKVMNDDQLLLAQQLVREIVIAEEMIDYAVQLVSMTHEEIGDANSYSPYIQFGSGPRGLQAIIRLAKARAFLSGRIHVSIGDIRTVAKPALLHRIQLNYEAEAEGITNDKFLDHVLAEMRKEAVG